MSAGPVRQRCILLVALLVGLLAACAHAEPGREVLASLEIEGNESIPAGEIEQRLALTETSRWPWEEPSYFDEGTLTGDRRRLLRFYQASGFYEARVRSRVRREDGEVHVTFVVEEGPPTHLASLTLRGLENLPPELRREVERQPLPLRQGDRISEAAWDATLAELERRLRERGYADAAATGTVEVDVEKRQATASIEVTPGPRVPFGRVVITGTVDIPRQTVLREVRRAIPEGSLYSDRRIAEAEANLLAMGVFGGVRVSRGPIDPATESVPLVVSVQEAPFQTLRAGVGAGIDSTRYSARLSADYTHRNFFGGLRTLRFENVLGWADLRGSEERGLVGSSAVDLLQPELAPRLDGNVRVEYQHDLDPAFRYDAVKGRIGFPWKIHRTLVVTPSYNVQRFWLEAFTETDGATSGNCQLEQGDCVLAFLEERIAWDRRDNPVDATRGWYASLSFQQGRPWLGSESSFDRILGELRWYQPLPWSWVLALRVEGGILYPHDGSSPIMQRFVAGGGTSVRSFTNARLSPQQLEKPDGDVRNTRDTVPIGGDALLEGSAELRLPLVGDLGLALFVDAGNVARIADDAGLTELLRPNVAVGTGLRYRTPFGPVRLDAGYRVVENLPCIVEMGRCTDVEIPDPPFALHFSIGQAF